MLIDGVKMACEACVRGHRVSGCNHSDRKLLPIAKKGRPVSQCNHCRHMRKSRSAHVKCDCGERLALLKEQAKTSGKPIPTGCHAGTPAQVEEGDSKTLNMCTCCHGGRCTCALKKDPQHLDSVPEFTTAGTCTMPTTTENRKPRLQMTQSESSLTTFANGHHRPTHKHHSSVHGIPPYAIPHVGHTGHTFGEHASSTKSPASAPPTLASQKPRRIKSEHSSPDLQSYPLLEMADSNIAPLDLSSQTPPKPITINKTPSGRIQPDLSVDTDHPPFTIHEFPGQEVLPSADSDHGYQFSAGLYPPSSAGWPTSFGQFDSTAFDEPFLGSVPSTSDIELFMSQGAPMSTYSNSGDEFDELIVPANRSSPYDRVNNGVLSSGSSDQADSENYRLSATSSYIGLPQIAASNNTLDDLVDMDKYFNNMPPPAQQLDAFAGWRATTDDGDSQAYGYGSDFSDYCKGGDLTTITPVVPPPIEDEILFMMPWSADTQHECPSVDQVWDKPGSQDLESPPKPHSPSERAASPVDGYRQTMQDIFL